MNRINPALFAAAFADWVRECWPKKAGLVAIDGKTSRRSHDRGAGAEPLHLVSAFATTSRLMLAQEAVPDKANQPSLRAEVEAAFVEAEAALDPCVTLDKGHGRIEERRMAVLREIDWLGGARRFPGELRLPGAACLLRAETRVESRGRSRAETRYFISSRTLTPAEAAVALREHWAIENRLHRVLDVTFGDDQSRLRKSHGARNMATVRHFALDLVRAAADKRSIKSRRKRAGWSPDYVQALLSSAPT